MDGGVGWVQVLMVSAQNCVYGSSLSPPRLAQIRDCCIEYFDHINPETDEYLQWWLPQLVTALRLDFDLTHDDIATVVDMLCIVY